MNNKQVIADYYGRYGDELKRYIGVRIKDDEEAADLVQNLFLHLLERNDMLITEETLPNLTYTMARNMVVDYYRRRHCREQHEQRLYRSDRTTEIESVVSARLLTERLERSLSRLSEDSARIYRLHLYDNMKVGEIAKELSLPYKHVEYRLGIARKTVRYQMSV